MSVTHFAREVLAIFGFEVVPEVSSEHVSLLDQDDEGAKLLAASVLLLGYRSDSELSEIVASLSTDLRTDGTIDSSSTMRALVLNARALDTALIRSGDYKVVVYEGNQNAPLWTRTFTVQTPE